MEQMDLIQLMTDYGSEDECRQALVGTAVGPVASSASGAAHCTFGTTTPAISTIAVTVATSSL